MAAGHEAIWVHLTVKLREWALKNNFDSFVYTNSFEGTNIPEESNSFITLKPDQAKKTGSYIFDKERYQDLVPPNFKRHLDEITRGKSGDLLTGVYWAGHNPAQFWKPK